MTNARPLFLPRPRRVARAFLMPCIASWLGWIVIAARHDGPRMWAWWVCLALGLLALQSGWKALVGLAWNRRVGLTLDDRGVTDPRATLLGPRTRREQWDELERVSGEDGTLCFVVAGKVRVRIAAGELDEELDFVLARARARLDGLAGRGEADVNELDQLAFALEAALCTGCGARLVTHVGEESTRCSSCGREDAASPSVKSSLVALAAALRAAGSPQPYARRAAQAPRCSRAVRHARHRPLARDLGGRLFLRGRHRAPQRLGQAVDARRPRPGGSAPRAGRPRALRG